MLATTAAPAVPADPGFCGVTGFESASVGMPHSRCLLRKYSSRPPVLIKTPTEFAADLFRVDDATDYAQDPILERADSVAKITELQREIGDGGAIQRDGFLQHIPLGATYTHHVALDARLHLELAVLGDAHQLLGQF